MSSVFVLVTPIIAFTKPKTEDRGSQYRMEIPGLRLVTPIIAFTKTKTEDRGPWNPRSSIFGLRSSIFGLRFSNTPSHGDSGACVLDQ